MFYVISLRVMTPGEKFALKYEVGRVFTPSAPIDKAALFAGRAPLITKLINAVNTRGQHAVLFGERGVGKTSLANVLRELLTQHRLDIAVAASNCDKGSSFASIWRNVLTEIPIQQSETGMGFRPPTHTTIASLREAITDHAAPEDIRQLLDTVDSPIIVILDEIDRIEQGQVKAALADTIKTFSDHASKVTLILVGVADSLDDLITEHGSVERALVQIHMPRMSTEELEEILDKGLDKLNMEINPVAAWHVTKLSHGLPHYTHSLALHASQHAIDRDSLTVTLEDVNRAVESALEQAQRSMAKRYDTAVSSPRGNLYAEVLLACTLSETDEMGYFFPGSVREPMRWITGKHYEISAFSRHLNEFCEERRGRVLQKVGSRRNYRFRFVNPLLEPYIVMKGVSKGLVPDSWFGTPATSF